MHENYKKREEESFFLLPKEVHLACGTFRKDSLTFSYLILFFMELFPYEMHCIKKLHQQDGAPQVIKVLLGHMQSVPVLCFLHENQ